MPALPVVIARMPDSVSVSSRTLMIAPGFEITLESFTKGSVGFFVLVLISIPFRDKVANGLGACTNYLHYIFALEQCAVT